MIGEKMRQRVLEAIRKFGPEQENALARYLEIFPEEKIQLSVWVDLLDRAGDTATVERLDPNGMIRAKVAKEDLPGFIDWWGEIPAAASTQLSLFN